MLQPSFDVFVRVLLLLFWNAFGSGSLGKKITSKEKPRQKPELEMTKVKYDLAVVIITLGSRSVQNKAARGAICVLYYFI